MLFAESQSHDFTGEFYRVSVKINVLKPLTFKNAVLMIRDNKRQIFKVKYECLPDWCAVCGHLGHVYKEHGDGIHPPSCSYFQVEALVVAEATVVVVMVDALVEVEVTTRSSQRVIFLTMLILQQN